MWEFWQSTNKAIRRPGGSPEPASRVSLDVSGGSADLSLPHANFDPRDSMDRRSSSLSPRPPRSPVQVSTHVDFKDLRIPIDDVMEEAMDSDACEKVDGIEYTGAQVRSKIVQKHKLIIVMVGLPGRGKTFLCNKLCAYLNWLGHQTQHFNVGYYRRKQNTSQEKQDASFFDKNNPEGKEKRQQALNEALNAMTQWLSTESAQVAIFDATNSTEERRRFLISKFHGVWQYLFIESVCNDPEVLEANYRYKMMYSPDYRGIDIEEAMVDFKERIRRYEQVYETLTDRNVHYIKLINMVTGRGHLDINRISGYIPGKIVFYLMQICKLGTTRTRKIWLSRHGESEYNVKELLGGDSGISRQGREYAQMLPNIIFDRLPLTFDNSSTPVSVWTSTLKRTIETAEYMPFPKLRWKALDEIHAGIFDSYTYKQIAEKYPQEFAARKANKLTYRYPNGESYLDLIQRLEPVIIEMERERENICIVAHQAILRAMYGYFTNKPLAEIPTLEIPLHTVIELTPKADGTMTEERFFTGIPTTKKLNAGRPPLANSPVFGSPSTAPPASDKQHQTEQQDPQAQAATDIPCTREPINVGSAPSSICGGSPILGTAVNISPTRTRAPSPRSLSFGHNGRSQSDASLNRPSMHIPALNQSRQWADSPVASMSPHEWPGPQTSDEGPGGPLSASPRT